MAFFPHAQPPSTDTFNSKLRRVCTNPNIDKTDIINHSINAVRRGVPFIGVEEVMRFHFFRTTFRSPCAAFVSKTLAEKVLFRQLGHVGATHDRVHHSFAIGRRVWRRGFSARVQLMPLLFGQIRSMRRIISISRGKSEGRPEGAKRPTAGDEPREFPSRGEGGRVPPFFEKLRCVPGSLLAFFGRYFAISGGHFVFFDWCGESSEGLE